MDNWLNTLRPGDPVKVTGRRGNFRFLGYYGDDSAEVVGPINGDGENAKVVRLATLKKPARTVTRASVAPNKLAVEISHSAHSIKRGG